MHMQPDTRSDSRLKQFAAEVRRDAIRENLADLPGSVQSLLTDEWQRNAAPENENRLTHIVAGERLTARADQFRMALDDDSRKRKARRLADDCARADCVEDMREIAGEIGIEPPNAKTEAGEVNRFKCEKWWRRQLFRHYSRAAESEFREIGLVHRKAQVYCSDATVHRRRDQKHRQRDLFTELAAVNDLGDVMSMIDLVDASVANPVNRRAELMTRIRGCEEIASAAGHVAAFLTLTTPSRFHARYSDGKLNRRYVPGNDARESQAWLCRTWSRIRAAWHRADVPVYGLRIAEPHHDGTTHWHMMLFLPAEAAAAAEETCKRHMMADCGDEPGAHEHRFKWVPINPKKGTAAGYIAKYVAKNIDGYQVGADNESGRCAIETAERVDAWASTYGIRQFQFVGTPPVGVWRELRRVRDPIQDSGERSQVMELCRAAADAGDWRAFVDAMGGYHVRLGGRVSLEKYDATNDENEYGEPLAAIVYGVECCGLVIETRTRLWFFVWADRVGSAWTCVNNCTDAGADEYEQFLKDTEPPTLGKKINV